MHVWYHLVATDTTMIASSNASSCYYFFLIKVIRFYYPIASEIINIYKIGTFFLP